MIRWYPQRLTGTVGDKMGFAYRTDWANIPDTDDKAVPMVFEEVQDAHVVWVESATIRDAIIKNHFMEIADPNTIGHLFRGNPAVEVRCLWYGRKPPTRWMRLTLCGDYKPQKGYSGPVVRDIFRPQ